MDFLLAVLLSVLICIMMYVEDKCSFFVNDDYKKKSVKRVVILMILITGISFMYNKNITKGGSGTNAYSESIKTGFAPF